MQTVRKYWTILPGLLLILLFTAPAWVRSAQTTMDTGKIVPMFSVSPNLLFAKQQTSVYVSIWNGNEAKGTSDQTTGKSKLQAGDTFQFAFDESKVKVDGIEPIPIVFSDTLFPSNFEGFHEEGSNKIAITYKGATKPFPAGDIVFIRVYLSIDSATGPAVTIFRKPADDSRFSAGASSPVFAVSSVIDGPQGLQGDQGLQGIQGLQGDQGLQGIQGLQGDQGLQGIQGDKGDQGLQGNKGDQGLQGLQGLQGDQGLQGLQGDQGLQGIQGLQGDQGLQGFQGMKGDQGLQGMKGDQGLQGMKGDQGLQGMKGDQGLQGMKGEKGDDGKDGKDGKNGKDCSGGDCKGDDDDDDD